jgi:hypothetical protein
VLLCVDDVASIAFAALLVLALVQQIRKALEKQRHQATCHPFEA